MPVKLSVRWTSGWRHEPNDPESFLPHHFGGAVNPKQQPFAKPCQTLDFATDDLFWFPVTDFLCVQKDYGAAITEAVPSPLPTTMKLPSGEYRAELPICPTLPA